MGRVIIVGLDGGCWELLESLMDRDFMPNLYSLRLDSCYAHIRSTDPPVTGPSWITIATGVNPGKHGCFDFNKPLRSLGKLKPLQSWDIKVKTFYEILKERGKKTILINLPGSYPPITDLITFTSILTRGENSVFPEKLKEEDEDFKNYRIFPDTSYLRRGNLKGYVEDIYDVEANRFKVLKKLFFRDWDCLFYLFSGGDWVSHLLYHKLLSKDAPESAIRIFTLFDEIIYFILKNIKEDDSLLIVSDHGFKRSKGVLHLNEILFRKGLLHPDFSNPSPPISHKMEENLFEKREFKKVPPPFLKLALRNNYIKYGIKALRKVGMAFPLFLKVDAKSSHCLMVSSESYGIYINDKTRFDDGIVDEGDVNELKSKMFQILNEIEYKGEKVFKELFFKEDIYYGDYVNFAPDIIFGNSDWGYSSGIRTLEVNPFVESEMGIHSHFGIFISFGRKMKRIEVPEGILFVADITPTILYLLGEKIPDNCDGKVFTPMIEDNYLKSNRIEYFKAEKVEREEKEIESDEIEKRLKELGYMQ